MAENGKQKISHKKSIKKTIISITALLLGIMIFAGILIKIIPTGVYHVRDDGSNIDGFCNILFPTSSILIIAIGILNIPYTKYMKFA